MRTAAVVLLFAMLAGAFSGCITDPDAEVKIAFSYKLTDLITDKDPRRLSEWLEQETGRSATIYEVDNNPAALQTLRFGQADLAFLDGTAGWIGYTQFGLDVLAADQKKDGRTYYVASAWVRADSDIQTVADLEGRDSCHTGLLKSAGMFMPLAYLIREGHIDATGYPDELSSVEDIAEDYFGDPTIGGGYGGYDGALRCLSDGTGEVAFVRDTSPADYCGDEPRDWCLDVSEYRKIVEFGPVPSHPVMVSDHVPEETRADLLSALLALNEAPEGQAILQEVLETPGITQVDGEEHLREFGQLLANLPGMDEHQADKYDVE